MESLEIRTRVGRVPAEVPDRALRLGRRRRAHLREQQVGTVDRPDGFVAVERRPDRRGEGFRVVVGSRRRVHRVEMDVVKPDARRHGFARWHLSPRHPAHDGGQHDRHENLRHLLDLSDPLDLSDHLDLLFFANPVEVRLASAFDGHDDKLG